MAGSPEVVGVPVSQAHRTENAVVGVPITQGRDEFDDDYQSRQGPVRDSRSEEPAPRAPSGSVYGANAPNASFGSPSGGYTYYASPSPQQAQPGRERSTSRSGTGNKKVVKISAEEVANWKSAFNVSQEIVIQALKQAKGDRNKTVELLQNPSRLGSGGGNVEVRRNVIRITQQEIAAFAKMFSTTETNVIQVMREVKGDRDKAISKLSHGNGLPAHAPAGFGTPGYFGTSGSSPSPSASPPSSSQPKVSLQEANQLAEVFGVADRKEEVAEIVEKFGGLGRDAVMNKLETLASQPPKATSLATPNGRTPAATASPSGGGGNAWDADALNQDDIEIMTDDFLGGDQPRVAADVDAPPARGAPARGNLPSAPGNQAGGGGMSNQAEAEFLEGGRTEQMLPPPPGTW